MGLPVLMQKRGQLHRQDEESAGLEPDPGVVSLVPAHVARTHTVFPLKFAGETLTLASVDPGNISLRDQLGFLLNKRIQLRAATREDILTAINTFYPQEFDAYAAGSLSDTMSASDFLTQKYEPIPARMRMPGIAAAKPSSDRLERMPTRASFAESAPAPRSSAWMALSESSPDPQRFAEPAQSGPNGEDNTPRYGRIDMFFETVEDGQRALLVHKDGRMEIVVGPARVWTWGKRILGMKHFVAHPGEFLIVRHRDGKQQHLTGPADVWFDPRVHEQITRQEVLQLADKEAVIVYSRPADAATVSRRIVYGPTVFVPEPGEWLHTFAWHGSDGGSTGQRKVAKGLVFQKLWLMPDQMYHDVPEVRTADDAVLTIKLMVFFELADIERMLETTHDPIGDFINAATSDAVDFVGRRTFEQFKHDNGKLNELETYRQLTARAAQTGYRITKVVYRGYGAPDRLQAMHDQAIEARTKLELDRATERQAQDLENFKLTAQIERAARRRTEQSAEVEAEIELARKRQEADLRQKEAERAAVRDQRRRDAEQQLELRRQAEQREREHLGSLREMGVDLTAYLTQGRADRVIEVRGGNGPTHLHLDGAALDEVT